LAGWIRQEACPGRRIEILEAGCGPSWHLQLGKVLYRLTGVDISPEALDRRKTVCRDLDEAILGDLCRVALAENAYDVIYSSFVLEHVHDARQVLDNFRRWLRPGGILVLRIPDRDSVWGLATRLTPFWFHILYKRYGEGKADAGKPGCEPFPVVYDRVVSRRGIRRWYEEHGMTLEAEYLSNCHLANLGRLAGPVKAAMHLLRWLSLGRLAADHNNLAFVIRKGMENKSS
jgi:SAM-dependent methyltransferase